MRAVVQRVSSASVQVAGKTVGSIDVGLMVLLGIEGSDTKKDADYLVEKAVGLRVFEDPDGKMNLSVNDVGGSVLVVSQFTLLGDVRKGKRPSFNTAAKPDLGNERYEYFVNKTRERTLKTETGEFRASMSVSLVNEGPVTILLDSKKKF